MDQDGLYEISNVDPSAMDTDTDEELSRDRESLLNPQPSNADQDGPEERRW